MAFDIPRNVILPLDRIEVMLDSGPHPFEVEHRDAIAANWRCETEENPAHFDGEVVLLSRLAYADRRLAGRCHTIRFSTFLYWRRHRSVGTAEHAYAHAALVAADNALVAIRMGRHTTNPGLVYFAAGSFEPSDFPNGSVDVDLNMAREVLEETGLDITVLRRDPGYHTLSRDTGTVIFRRYLLDEDAETIAARIREFVARDANPEIEGPVVIRNERELPEKLAPHMVPLVEWHFGGSKAT
jgi:8-oxo-dGTP pyrophosphatase MutT (NUDIX family)